jgi:hypothetical protein
VLSALAAFSLTLSGSRSAAWLLAAWSIVAVGLLRLLARGAATQPADPQALLSRLSVAELPDERWSALVDVARATGACGVTLRLSTDGGANRTERSWRDRRASGDDRELLSWSLQGEEGDALGTLEVIWRSDARGPTSLVEELPQALQRSLSLPRGMAPVVPLRRTSKR